MFILLRLARLLLGVVSARKRDCSPIILGETAAFEKNGAANSTTANVNNKTFFMLILLLVNNEHLWGTKMYYYGTTHTLLFQVIVVHEKFINFLP